MRQWLVIDTMDDELDKIVGLELGADEIIAIDLKDDVTLTADQETLLCNAIERLKKQEPIQYILGYSDFCGLNCTF